MKTTTLRSLLAALFTAVACVSAQGQLFTNSFTNSATAFGNSVPVTLTLNQFNTLGGTLTLQSVTVSVISATLGGSFEIGTGPASTVDYLGSEVFFSIAQAPTNTLGFTTYNSPPIFDPASSPGVGYTVGTNTTQVFTVSPSVELSNLVEAIASPNWGAYEGNGTIAFDLINNMILSVDVTGGIHSESSDPLTLDTVMSVTYVFVPEPSTYALLLVSALGAGVFALRRRQRAGR